MLLDIVINIIILPAIVFAYYFYKKTQSANGIKSGGTDPTFTKFQYRFFVPYFMALFSDWLQGPYVYQLYSYYGFAQGQIAVLFMAGFGASATIGTATGPLADKFGRKKLITVFCFLYTASCLTKLSPNFNILLLGRLLGGTATSILFSVFESWYLYQHTVVHKFPLEWISITFSKTTFFNGLLAIIAGIVGDIAVDRLELGPVSPFMISIPFLIIAWILVYRSWDENYGEQEVHWQRSCIDGLQTIMRNPVMLLLGIIQSIFESNMYIFVFLWTPVLGPGSPPLGLTFSCFMIAIMVGSSVYSYLLNQCSYKSESILSICLAIVGVVMCICSVLTSPFDKNVIDNSSFILVDVRVTLLFICFMVLEIVFGIYFPTIGYLRGEVLPESLRANIMNWFRAPLNLITCTVLLGIRSSDSPRLHQIVFGLCGLTSVMGFFLSKRFRQLKAQSVFNSKDRESAGTVVDRESAHQDV